MAGEKSIEKLHDEVYLRIEKESEYFSHVLIFVEQVKNHVEICNRRVICLKENKQKVWLIGIN